MKYLPVALLIIFINQLDGQSRLTIEQIMQGPDFVGHLPDQPFWSADSRSIYFQWNQDSLPDNEMYHYSFGAPAAERLSVEGVKSLESSNGIYSKDEATKLYQKNGDLFLRRNGTVLQVTNTLQYEAPRGFSIDDKLVVFEMADNLFTWSIEGGTIEQLTQFKKGDEKKEEKLGTQDSWLERDQLEYFEILRERNADEITNKEISKIYETKRPKEIYLGKNDLNGLAFSPDLNYVIYHIEKSVPPDMTIVPDYVTKSGYTKDLKARSKVAGEQSTYKSFIYDRTNDTVIGIDFTQIPGIYDKPEFRRDYHTGPESYIDTFDKPRQVAMQGPIFSEKGNHAIVVARSLDHKDRWIMEMNPATGKLALLNRQRDEAWIGGPGVGGWSLSMGDLGFVDEETLWFQSEETGYSHLYLYHFGSQTTEPLTAGNFEILGAHLSRDKKTFFITSNRENSFENHFYHFSVSDKKWKKITGKPGGYQVVLSPDEEKLAVLFSYSNQPTELFWMDNMEGAIMNQITKSTTSKFKEYAWRDPEIIHFKARDGAMVPARLYEPNASNKNGAAVIFVHGAGYLHNVHKYWSSYYREFMFHNFLADQGYTVLDIDYRGSAGFGRAWRTAIYRHMGGKDLDDQVDGAKYLVDLKGIDADRLGIYGGSYGGFITLMALCTSPGTFKCGAALRSVTDWAHYNHGYTSNILNTPSEDSIAYYRSSPIYHAEGLQGDLIMLHGMVDRNVHFQDVVRMSQRFIELGKDNWELAIFPMEDHGFVEASSWTDEYKRIFRLFEKNLKNRDQ